MSAVNLATRAASRRRVTLLEEIVIDEADFHQAAML
jgi:hypothetical protein